MIPTDSLRRFFCFLPFSLGRFERAGTATPRGGRFGWNPSCEEGKRVVRRRKKNEKGDRSAGEENRQDKEEKSLNGGMKGQFPAGRFDLRREISEKADGMPFPRRISQDEVQNQRDRNGVCVQNDQLPVKNTGQASPSMVE